MQPKDPEVVQLQELAETILSAKGKPDSTQEIKTAIDAVSIVRSDHPMQPFHRVMKPAVWLTAQGSKMTLLGGKRFDYRAGQAFVVTVEVPCRCSVLAASAESPYLGLVIELDRVIAQEVMGELGIASKVPAKQGVHSGYVLDLNQQLIDCAMRSLKLLKTPEAIPTLFPGIMREMCYWLLKSPGGRDLVHMTLRNVNDRRVYQAIRLLRTKFRGSISVEELAEKAGMSAATFHRQFKALPPLQYQKQLRLLEGRRLILGGNTNVESIAYEIGYVSASQFSREFHRMFGQSPRREIADGLGS